MIKELTEFESYAAQFKLKAPARAHEPAWLTEKREAAIDLFEEIGFPTRNDEEWRFSNPAQVVETPFKSSAAAADSSVIDRLADGYRLTVPGKAPLLFLNGRYVSGRAENGERALIMPISEMFLAGSESEQMNLASRFLAKLRGFERHAFAALNTALFEDGVFIFLPPGCVVEHPIEILHISSGGETLSSPRMLVIAEEGSNATIVETFAGIGAGASLSNAFAEIVVRNDAVVDHYKRCEEPNSAFHVGLMSVALGDKSTFASHSITTGGRWVRNEVYATLQGEHAECTLNGLYLASGTALVDSHTTIDHASPNCNSHEVYKGILDGRARGVFNGKIFVRLDAQKTDAKQTNKTLLLSPDARIDTKPQLEILADDVKCTHGATVGQLDPNQVFYLRSRGLSDLEARNLLTYAFAGDIVQRIKCQPLRQALDRRLLELLPR